MALAAALLDACWARGWTLATCESLTGGGVGAIITSVPGSSRVFRGGLITYATDLKVSLAGVDADFVAIHGVINSRTAREMAAGAARACAADVAIATTGVAGPDSEDGVAPGLVWLAVCWPGPGGHRVAVRRLCQAGDRGQVRAATVESALTFALECVGTEP